ncbi:MAG: class I SAM-dependent methyltransferase [Acidimicrobiales bacterium]
MPDACFADPRLAACYDALDPDRSDLEVYAAIVQELDCGSVLDVGCGTGTFACMLARRGIDVVGVDPAAASLDVARAKPGAARVRWIHGDVGTAGALGVDLTVMTGNVAQVFVGDAEWSATLGAVRTALRPGGSFVFESRVPGDEAWRSWKKAQSHVHADVHGVGRVEHWVEVTLVDGPLVTFRGTYSFPSGAVMTSTSTLRFRTCDELSRSLTEEGFVLTGVRDAPDRPGREYVLLAARP